MLPSHRLRHLPAPLQPQAAASLEAELLSAAEVLRLRESQLDEVTASAREQAEAARHALAESQAQVRARRVGAG